LQKYARVNNVAPDSRDSQRDTEVHAAQAVMYKRKKMSSAVFCYFMHNDLAQKTDLQVDISNTLQEHRKCVSYSHLITYQICTFPDIITATHLQKDCIGSNTMMLIMPCPRPFLIH